MSRQGGYIDPNFPNPMGRNDATIIIYGYTPSLAVGVLGVALFTIAAATHLFLLVRHRSWYFSPLLIGTLMEIVGYIFRLLSSQQDPYSVPWFVVQYFFIVVAPVFFSAAIYTIVSVMISFYGREFAPLPPKVVLGVFVACDVVATVVQIAGAALVGVAYSNERDPTTPNNILLAGLAFQVFSFAVFLGVLGWTLVKARRSPERISRGFVVGVVVATLAVYLRTLFRLAETAEGLMEKLSTHEVFFGCLEFAPIVVAVFIFTYWHPGRWLKSGINTGSEVAGRSKA
ncbi:Putative RTA-like protein [Septoria linicola]|uniref:RTA-like protein n=1 Tax=Septoria linicola TaxID=215465 RepID=A0A9Q9EJH1_9PEZI|nr:putative RTA-like protein [Septoria linicola]USW52214.1 Putative RTA-like protein [Septoria linicola]